MAIRDVGGGLASLALMMAQIWICLLFALYDGARDLFKRRHGTAGSGESVQAALGR